MVSSGVVGAALSEKPSVVTLVSMIYSLSCPPVPWTDHCLVCSRIHMPETYSLAGGIKWVNWYRLMVTKPACYFCWAFIWATKSSGRSRSLCGHLKTWSESLIDNSPRDAPGFLVFHWTNWSPYCHQERLQVRDPVKWPDIVVTYSSNMASQEDRIDI